MTGFIPVNEPSLTGNEKKYLLECIESGWISSEGPFVAEFEEKFAARMGRKHGIAVCNGTAAIDATVEALGIGPGDEVILPSFTIISCVNQIVRSGATPVLVDSQPDTWNMDVASIEAKVTPRTKAIMAVHIFGLPVDMDPLLDVARRYGLKVIEDAAEVHGQTYKGKPCGSFGDVSTFSFYSNKHITTGEGGMILTDDDELAEVCRSLRNLCFKPENRFVHDRLGWNLRMTNMQAALGLAQLEQLDEFVSRKRAMGKIYHQLLKDIPSIQLPLKATDFSKNIYWVFGVVLGEELAIDAKGVMLALKERGIGTRPFFCPMHLQPVLKRLGFFQNEELPNAEKLWNRGFYLPMGLGQPIEAFERAAGEFRWVLQQLPAKLA
jgi:perosamine synthetase